MHDLSDLNLPNKIYIGSFTYDLIIDPTLDGIYGETCFDSKTIRLKPESRLPVLKDTILHEVLHAIMEHSVILSPSFKVSQRKREEALIRFLSPRLIEFQKLNPILASFIFS